MKTYEEYMAMVDKADAAGDTAAAADLYKLAQKAKNPEPVTNEFFRPAEDGARAVAAGTPGFLDSAAESFSDFGRGIHAGGGNIARDVIRLGLEATGKQDQLDLFNESTRRAKEKQAVIKERSPWAFGAGDILGEGIALSPVGGATGLLTKGVWKGLAAEGAASGFITSEGDDIVDRSQDAALGAGLGVAGGKAVDMGTEYIGTAVRAARNKHQGLIDADVEERISLEVNPRVEAAKDYGGFDLDGNTALATASSLQEVNSIIGKGDVVSQRMANNIARQEEDIANRAGEFVDQFGPDRVNSDEAGEVLSVALADIRKADREVFEESYRRLDEIATSQNFKLPNRDRLASQVDSMDYAPQAEAVATDIKKMFNQYGIGAGVSSPEDSVRFLTNRLDNPQPQFELTFGTYNELRKKLNGFYGKPLNGAEKEAIYNAKKLLDDHIESAMQDERIGGSLAVRLARKATKEFKEFQSSWDDKEIVSRIANSVDGTYSDLDYSKVVQRLTSRSNTKGLDEVKAKLLTQGERGQQVWASLQQAPLLDALEKAIADSSRNVAEGGVIQFNHKVFEATLRKNVSESAQATLWGGAKYDADFIKKAIASWKTRDRKALASYRQNPSGTALALMTQLKFLPSGIGGRVSRTAAGVSDAVADTTFGRAGRSEATDLMMSGEVSSNVRSDMALESVAKFEAEYRGGASRQYAQMISDILRRGIVFNASDDDTDQ